MRRNTRLVYAFCCVATLLLTSVPTFAAEEEAAASAPAKRPGAAMILSTGDNLFYYKWFPTDSTIGVGASFDIFKSHYHVDRIIWRGAHAEWMTRESVFRPESIEIADLYTLEMAMETQEHHSRKVGVEARKRGLSYWGYTGFLEVGAGPDVVSMSGFGPYNFEEKLRADHPEFRLYDRAGISSGGTIELGYPEVRKALLGHFEDLLREGGGFSFYDGIIFYTYVENFFPRNADQFIFSEYAINDFRKRYGVDVLTQPFDLEKYLEMRGEYVTQYLRELRQLFNRYDKRIAFYFDALNPDVPQHWPSFPDVLVPGRLKIQWRDWIKEGLIDEIVLRNSTKLEVLQPFLDATEGTNVRVGLVTNQVPPELRFLIDRGVKQHIWSPELPSDFPKEDRPLEELESGDPIAMMSVLRQIRDGSLDAPAEKITPLFTHPDMIVRRQAVAAVLGRRMTDAIPALEQAAMDPENSFRSVAIDALGTLHGPNTVSVIGKALATYPHSGTSIVARTAWAMMFAERSDEIVRLYQQAENPFVRRTILELIVAKHAVPPVDAVPSFRPVVNAGAKDPDEKVRMMAGFGTAYYPDGESAQLLLSMLEDPKEAVQYVASFSLGEVARRLNDRDLRERIFQKLVKQWEKYGSNSTRGDLQWGYRSAAESLVFGFGPRGERQLVRVLNGKDPRLADQAWRVLFHPNDGWNYYPLDRERTEALTAYYPGAIRTKIEKKTYSLPAEAVILSQNFAGITPDPTGQFGNAWVEGGKWSGLDENVRFGESSSKSFIEIGVDKSGKGTRMAGTKGFDMEDRRFRNRLRGHFPASPVAHGVADGITELSVDVRKSVDADALGCSLSPDSKSRDRVGFSIARDGRLTLRSTTGETATQAVAPKAEWQVIVLRLDFNTGKASLFMDKGKGAPLAELSFDSNRHYRAIVLEAAGDPGSATQIGEIRLTQKFDESPPG